MIELATSNLAAPAQAIADAILMWGVLAGALCLADVLGTARQYAIGEAKEMTYSLAWETIGKAGVAGFLLSAGFIIPLEHLIDWPDRGHPIYPLTLELAWLFISLAGWGFAISRAQWRMPVIGCAVVSLPAFLLASIASIPV